MRVAAFLSLVVLGFVACSAPPNPPSDRCTGVHCPGSQLCNQTSGQCEALPSTDAGWDGGGADGGVDAGNAVDAGTHDAGRDAGTSDAGTDAGTDAGLDAGVPLVDAGCVSDTQCPGIEHCDPRTRECVECFLNAQCPSPVIPVCDQSVHQCTQCVVSSDCANPTPICDQHQCLPCTTSAECGLGRECNRITFACDPLNDACASARAILALGTGSTSISAEPSQALDDTPSGCGPAGPELVYTFTTTAVQNLVATATPFALTSVRPALFLRAGCTGSAMACDSPATGASTISVANLAPGTWFLFVEAQNGTSGRVTLDVTLLDPPSVAANDTCASPTALAVNGGSVTRSVGVGTTALATNASTTDPTCSVTGRSGPDVVFTYTLASQANVTATVRPLSGSTLHPIVSLRSTCLGAGELACQAASSATAVQTAVSGQAAGTYFVSVDSADGTSGSFQLELEATPVVANDSCASATALTFTNGLATALGDTRWATNGNLVADQSPGCSSSARGTGTDLVYSFTTSQPQDVTVQVTPTGMSPSYEPVISIRSACADGTSAAELACVSPLSATSARVDLINRPPGTWFVWVDSGRDTSGPFQLEVALSAATPAPANDGCAAPQVLSFTNQQATFTGSTLQATNSNSPGDVSPTCNSSAKQNGRDVVYQFTLAQTQDVALEVLPASGSSLIPAVYLRKGTCTSQLLADELTCTTSVSGVQSQLTRLGAGTYFLFVDSSGNSTGGFTGTVTLSAPTPAPGNDDCAGAQPLVFAGSPSSATVIATTATASNSNSAIDNAPACGASFFPRRTGRDLVYSYTLPAARDVEITVTPSASSTHVPVLYVRAPGQCTSFSAGFELTCVAQSSIAPLREVLPNQPAGTYFLFVDSNDPGAGPFSLTVTQRPATLPPSNDACSAPMVVPHGTAGVSGDTTAATDSYSSLTYSAACRRGLLHGRDLIFQYTAPSTGTVTATVTPEASFNPSLLLLTGGCAAAQCARGVDAAPAGVPESFSFPVTQGATYFLVVDATDSEAPNAFGSFTLTVL